MVNCAVSSCKRRSATSNLQNQGVSYHLFPKDPYIREKWRIFCCQTDTWRPTRTSVVCSEHFTTECFQVLPKNRRKLVDGAVPTLKIVHYSEDQLAKVRKISETAVTSETVSSVQSLQTLIQPVSSLLQQGKHPVLTFDNENRLAAEIKDLEKEGFTPTRDMIRKIAFEFAEKLGLNVPFNKETRMAGVCWLTSFLERHPEVKVRRYSVPSLQETEKKRKVDAVTSNLIKRTKTSEEMSKQPKETVPEYSHNSDNNVIIVKSEQIDDEYAVISNLKKHGETSVDPSEQPKATVFSHPYGFADDPIVVKTERFHNNYAATGNLTKHLETSEGLSKKSMVAVSEDSANDTIIIKTERFDSECNVTSNFIVHPESSENLSRQRKETERQHLQGTAEIIVVKTEQVGDEYTVTNNLTDDTATSERWSRQSKEPASQHSHVFYDDPLMIKPEPFDNEYNKVSIDEPQSYELPVEDKLLVEIPGCSSNNIVTQNVPTGIKYRSKLENMKLDEVDMLFLGYAAAVKKLSHRKQIIVKQDISRIMTEAEQSDLE